MSLLEWLNQTAVSPCLKRNSSPQLITGFSFMYLSLIWSLNPTEFALSYSDFAQICCICLWPSNSSRQQNPSFSVFSDGPKADILTAAATEYVHFNIDAYNGTAIRWLFFVCLFKAQSEARTGEERSHKPKGNHSGAMMRDSVYLFQLWM